MSDYHESYYAEGARMFAAQRDEAQRKVAALEARLATVGPARLDQLRVELAPLFSLCQWAHAVAGLPLQFKPEVAAAEQALISFLHEPSIGQGQE